MSVFVLSCLLWSAEAITFPNGQGTSVRWTRPKIEGTRVSRRVGSGFRDFETKLLKHFVHSFEIRSIVHDQTCNPEIRILDFHLGVLAVCVRGGEVTGKLKSGISTRNYC